MPYDPFAYNSNDAGAYYEERDRTRREAQARYGPPPPPGAQGPRVSAPPPAFPSQGQNAVVSPSPTPSGVTPGISASLPGEQPIGYVNRMRSIYQDGSRSSADRQAAAQGIIDEHLNGLRAAGHSVETGLASGNPDFMNAAQEVMRLRDEVASLQQGTPQETAQSRFGVFQAIDELSAGLGAEVERRALATMTKEAKAIYDQAFLNMNEVRQNLRSQALENAAATGRTADLGTVDAQFIQAIANEHTRLFTGIAQASFERGEQVRQQGREFGLEAVRRGEAQEDANAQFYRDMQMNLQGYYNNARLFFEELDANDQNVFEQVLGSVTQVVSSAVGAPRGRF